MRGTLFSLACASAMTLTGCAQLFGPSGDDEVEVQDPITIEEAKEESVRIQNELAALIPEEDKSPDKLPLPGEVIGKPMRCGDEEGLFNYPGGSAVRINEGVDGQALVDKLTAHLRGLGWDEKDIPTNDRPERTMQTSPEGYQAIISVLDRSDDLPIITIDVWSPCATLPEGVNEYAYKI
ncbi:hypothetical protein [Corynebacterium sp. p3-SID1194]|uniref:hypothetical protein n=1 Tax=Corynebacterium sp. p3-SID1194 TaxID=2916105 RepID=UPI0021A44590|nr:hypothetical protein [Corynebacterium sp. p3-SID1194]MCT1449222.1 hypothetical protein [Corynebacterium sp. p3-SID1194]